MKRTLYDDVQVMVRHLDEKFRQLGDQVDKIGEVTDRNVHSQCASINALINENKDIRQLVDNVARRMDQPS